MREALRLAERGRGQTHPNPMVGAVLVQGGRVVGRGFHRAPGRPHAEVEALRQAGRRARGSTLYVTLEPCAHQGRTPPCAPALVEAGVRKVVAGIRDPHCIVNGRGLAKLRAAGLKVEVGLLSDEIRHALGGYMKAMTVGLPRVSWKLAVTLDGKVADARRHARWISSAESRRMVHRLRVRSDAVVVGSGTALADDPRLTARGLGRVRQPLRVLCDTGLRSPESLRLLKPPLARGTVVACGRSASIAREERLRQRGVRVWRLPERGGRVSATALLRRLAKEGHHEVLLEGGPELGSDWLRRGLVDRLLLFVSPRVLGAEGLAWCGPLGLRRLERAKSAGCVRATRVGRDTLLVAEGLS